MKTRSRIILTTLCACTVAFTASARQGRRSHQDRHKGHPQVQQPQQRPQVPQPRVQQRGPQKMAPWLLQRNLIRQQKGRPGPGLPPWIQKRMWRFRHPGILRFHGRKGMPHLRGRILQHFKKPVHRGKKFQKMRGHKGFQPGRPAVTPHRPSKIHPKREHRGRTPKQSLEPQKPSRKSAFQHHSRQMHDGKDLKKAPKRAKEQHSKRKDEKPERGKPGKDKK